MDCLAGRRPSPVGMQADVCGPSPLHHRRGTVQHCPCLGHQLRLGPSQLHGPRHVFRRPQRTTGRREAKGPPCRAAAAQLLSAGGTQASGILQALQQQPVLRDTCATVVATLGAVALVKTFEALTSRGIVDQKLSRKLVHIMAGPGFALTWPLFSSDPNARFFAAIVPCLNLVRVLALGTGLIEDKKTVNAMSREGDRRELLRGPLYYVLVLIVATTIYWRESPVGVVAFSLMCGGDGLADIVGRRLGANNRLPWNAAKSWAGSGAMFLGGTAMALGFVAFFCGFGYFECDMGAMAGSVALIAAVATVIESLPVNQKLDDNISVPGAVALLGFLLRGAMLAA